MNYREKRLDWIRDNRKTAESSGRVGGGFGPAPMRDPDDAEYERMVAQFAGFPRENVKVNSRNGSIWYRRGAAWVLLDESPKPKREIRQGKAHIYNAGDKTTVVTNPDGSPYQFKSGSQRGQMAELEAMVKTSKHLNLPKDCEVKVHH